MTFTLNILQNNCTFISFNFHFFCIFACTIEGQQKKKAIQMINNDTICALATAQGGALGIIRVSGPKAFDTVSHICSLNCANIVANTVHYTHIVSPENEIVDEVLVSIFHAPHSYTSEDSVEISCHASRYILNKVLELLITNGCRMANPGEFTQRAYFNGKIDLSQAEAVADLISSTNRASHRIAMSQLRGGISTELATLRNKLLKLTSLLELELDFSDHEELEFADRNELLELTNTIKEHINRLAHSFKIGQALKNGIPVAIVGKTNVGKSTLLNAILNDNRAIVSDIHGTTRDTIEESIDINGVQFRFIDTAGLRQTKDEIEQIGIDRTLKKINEAQIIIWLLDSIPDNNELDEIKTLTKGKDCLFVHNKADLIDTESFKPYISPLTLISAKAGTGIEQLKEQIYKTSHLQNLSGNEVIVTNARHYDALLRAQESIQYVLNGLQQNLSGDLLSEDLRQTLDILAEITGGKITPQETLNNIFKNFCVGK